MKKNTFFLFFVLFAISTTITNAQDANPNMGIIPAPVSIKKTTGEFILSRETILLADSLNNKAVIFLADYLRDKLIRIRM
jgi:hexosaminidase